MVGATYIKVCAVMAVLYAGWNIYRVMSTFKEVVAEMNEYKLALGNEEDASRMNPWGIVIYLALYGVYLTLLYHAALNPIILLLTAFKFLLTAMLGFWIAQSIFKPTGYTKLHHQIARVDNVVNISFAVLLIYALIYPLPF